jgi:uncharacterized protein YeaO (DUF488 family)
MMARAAIVVKRAYDPVSRADGPRFLVERLWPRGISKARLRVQSRPEAWKPIVSAVRRGSVTLVYSSHDTEHNKPVALQEYLEGKMQRPAKAVAADPRAGRPAR